MKKKLFPKIIYYVFTFSLGLLLAFVLPWYFSYYQGPLNDMQKYLESGEQYKAMMLVGGYFDKEPAFYLDFGNNSGIVLYEATTLVVFDKEDLPEGAEAPTDGSKLQKTYAGFIYGIKDSYNVGGEENNQTKLVVTNLNGDFKNVPLLDYDIDGNGTKENIGTLISNGFIYLDLDCETYGSLSKLTFVDKDGNAFKEVNLELRYDEKFFSDVTPFFDEYNSDYKSDKLASLSEEFLAKNGNYVKSAYGDTLKRGDVKATVVIVCYFVVIYIIGDFLVGSHYILRFFRWLFGKIRKNKKKPTSVSNGEIFGHDYYSQVTVSLDLSEVENFSESVQLKYSNSENEAVFNLLKAEEYSSTQRIKAGTYVNAFMDINRNYAPVDMPETLIVEGYKMSVKIKIIKRKEESV